MRIQRIQWAGILLDNQKHVIMIDPVFKSFNKDFFGTPLESLHDLSTFKNPDVILITHLHSDHFDPHEIIRLYGENITLIVPISCVREVKALGFKNVISLKLGEMFTFGDFEIIPEFSADGLGEEQVCWIIKHNNRTVIHCGETLWHGHLWRIANQYGPFDIAFLPINTAIMQDEGMIPSNQPICLNAEQAISAAEILQTKILVPIHYGTFHNPPNYNGTKNPIERLLDRKTSFELNLLKNGEEFTY